MKSSGVVAKNCPDKEQAFWLEAVRLLEKHPKPFLDGGCEAVLFFFSR